MTVVTNATRQLQLRDKTASKMRALGSEFGRTNRLVTGDPRIFVNVMSEPPGGMDQVPGWSRYPGIFINAKFFPELKSHRALVALLGLNYHELSHLMFTPRDMKATLRGSDVQMAWNCLEDQRIESLFTALYHPAGKYFTEMVIKMFVGNQSTWESAFLFTYGRSYLPLEIREEFEARFSGSQRDLQRAKEIIDEFKAYTSSYQETHKGSVQALCEDFARIMNQNRASGSDCGGGDQDKGDPKRREERKATKEDQRRRQEEEETGEDQSGFWEDEEDEESPEDAESEGTASEDDADSDSDDQGDGEDDNSEDESDSDSGGDDEGDSDDEGSESEDGDSSSGENGDESASESGEEPLDSESGGPSGDGEHEEWDDDDFKDYLNEVVQAVHEDEDVVDEVEQIQTSISERKTDVIDFDHRPNWHDIDDAMRLAVQKTMKEFRRVYAEVEPGWRYGSDTGRLNVGRAIAEPENYDEMFDEWEEGREQESGIEAYLLLDTSGSMHGYPMEMTYKAFWIIKRALDDVGAKTTAVAFDSDTTGLMSRNEPVKVHQFPVWKISGGSTEPAQGMHIGRRLLDASPMPNKLFVILTDGGWSWIDPESDTGVADFPEIISSIPGTKMYVGIGSGVYSNREVKGYFDATVEMSTFDDLVEAVKATVTKMVESARRR